MFYEYLVIIIYLIVVVAVVVRLLGICVYLTIKVLMSDSAESFTLSFVELNDFV